MEIPGYRLGTVIGQGGMGRVYEGEQLTLRRRVAVKVLAPELMGDASLITRFKLEVTLLGGLHHPNIVRVIDSGFTGSTFYYAMEYCDGGTLKGRLREYREEGRRYSPQEAVDLACALLDGLEVVHANKVVHRDIKPGNIFFAENDRPVLGDFGLARDLAGVRLTIDPQAMGTPLYMSPEARLGEEIDRRSDVFQIARVLHEMLSGEDPNSSAPVWLRLTPKTEVPSLTKSNPRVSVELAAVVARALSWKADDRPQTAKEFREELQAAELEGGEVTSTEGNARTPAGAAKGPRGLPPRSPTPKEGSTPPPRARSQRMPNQTASLNPNFQTTTGRRKSSNLVPLMLVACALAMGLGTGAYLFWPHATSPDVAPSPSASAGGEPPRVEGLRVEYPAVSATGDAPSRSGGPVLELTCQPAAQVAVSEGGAEPLARAPAASRHRVELKGLGPGRHTLAVALDSGSGATTLTVPLYIPAPGMPPRHCLGIVMKECFDFGTHTNNPRFYDDTLLESVAQAGPSAVTTLVDPERDDPGLPELCRQWRKYGLEIDFSLYLNKFPANPAAAAERLSAMVKLVAGLGQKQVYFSPGILIDTIGWSEGWPRYRDFLELVAKVAQGAPIPVHLTSGNLYSRGTQSLTAMLQSGAGKFVSSIVLTHRYTLKVDQRPPVSLAELEALALKFGVQRLDWVFDVNSPETGEGGGLLEHDLVGSVMADPALRDVAASLDQRKNKAGMPFLPLAKEDELLGSRMRESARLMAGGALVLWDQMLCADPADGNRLRLRGHPAGIRLLVDFMVSPGEEPQSLATESARARIGLEPGGVEGVVRDTPGGPRLLLWSEQSARQRVLLKSSRPVLVAPLLQANRGPFVATLKLPVSGRVEIPVTWSPVLVELLP